MQAREYKQLKEELSTVLGNVKVAINLYYTFLRNKSSYNNVKDWCKYRVFLNEAQHEARNKIIALATSEYIARLSPKDEGAVEELKEIVEGGIEGIESILNIFANRDRKLDVFQPVTLRSEKIIGTLAAEKAMIVDMRKALEMMQGAFKTAHQAYYDKRAQKTVDPQENKQVAPERKSIIHSLKSMFSRDSLLKKSSVNYGAAATTEMASSSNKKLSSQGK